MYICYGSLSTFTKFLTYSLLLLEYNESWPVNKSRLASEELNNIEQTLYTTYFSSMSWTTPGGYTS